MICGFESAYSLIAHITIKHKTLMKDYREKFPGKIVQKTSDAQRRKLSLHHKKRLEDPEALSKFLEWRSFPSEVKHWLRKGFSLEEANEKVANFQSEQSLKGNNEKTRLRRSKKNLGTKNPMSLFSISKRHGVSIKEASALTPAYGRSGEKHPMFGKKHTPESLLKIARNNIFFGKSKLEHEVTNTLVELFRGEKNAPVFGWICDYLNEEKKIIVEFFGDFWHHNPTKYGHDYVNPFTKRTSSFIWERDERKISELTEQGYLVIVVWESDWNANKEACLQRLKDAFN
jgi:G:T-mismatch repair DNA endonuclease (very short patch repair protein)